MSLIEPRGASSSKTKVELWTTLGLTLVLAFFLISGVIAYRNIEVLRINNEKIRHTHAVLISIDELFSTTQDAETGQRGYLLTGNDRYLEPIRARSRTSPLGSRPSRRSSRTIPRSRPI